MCPRRQQPPQPVLIAGHGYNLKNIARRTFDERGHVHTLWLDDAFANDPILPIPPELPHEVIFGDKSESEDNWTILRLPDNLPGSRARFANEYQSGHQRVAEGLDFERFPRDAATDEHLAEADMNNLYRWLEREWGWDHDLAEGVFHLQGGKPDSQGLHRTRVDTEEEWQPDYKAQSAMWENNLRKVTEGFPPSCSGPNAMATLHVLAIAIGYIPNLTRVVSGSPGCEDPLARGGIIYEGTQPAFLKSRKFATESTAWAHRVGFLSQVMGFDLSESIDDWTHWQYRQRSGRASVTALHRIGDILKPNFRKCLNPSECTALDRPSYGHETEWWRTAKLKWPLQRLRQHHRFPHEPIGIPTLQPDHRLKPAEEPRRSRTPTRGRSPSNRGRSPRDQRESKESGRRPVQEATPKNASNRCTDERVDTGPILQAVQRTGVQIEMRRHRAC